MADSTLTLALPKTGLDAESVGDLMLADIGIPVETYRRTGLSVSPRVFCRFLHSSDPGSIAAHGRV